MKINLKTFIRLILSVKFRLVLFLITIVGVNIYLTIDIQFNQITEVKAELSDLNETIMIQKAEIEELKSNILEVNEIHLGNNSNSKTIIYKDENGTMVTGFT